MLLLIGSALALLLVALLGILLVYSPGTLNPLVDDTGASLPASLSEKRFLTIGGVRQGMFIRSTDVNHPVLFYVHGGPAFPNYFLIDMFHPGLEQLFTVCYYEQRGGGLSYSPQVTDESMTFDQLAADAIEITQYLRQRFAQQKIYLFAHSGGTPIALLAVARAPELFHAYIGMGQVTHQAESERLAYGYIVKEYRARGDQHRVAQLTAYADLSSDSAVRAFYTSPLRDQCMHELGIGTMHTMKSVFWDIFIPVWACKAYTLSEKINIWKSKIFFLPKSQLIPELLETDFAANASTLNVPVYFFSGTHDLTVNVNLSRAYLAKLHAPLKGFYTFTRSAHSPLFEEPERALQILATDVLRGDTSLSDDQ